MARLRQLQLPAQLARCLRATEGVAAAAFLAMACSAANTHSRTPPSPPTSEVARVDKTTTSVPPNGALPGQCDHPLQLAYVRQVAAAAPTPADETSGQSSTPERLPASVEVSAAQWSLRATARSVAASPGLRVYGPILRWTLELYRGGRLQRQVAIGKAVRGVPSLALSPEGTVAVAWKDRSPKASSFGGTGGLFTEADEQFVAVFDAGNGKVTIDLFEPRTIEVPAKDARPFDPAAPPRAAFASELQLGWWSGAFHAIAYDSQGLKQWRLGPNVRPVGVALIDPMGADALLRVAEDGRVAVVYTRRPRLNGSAANLVFVQLNAEHALGGDVPLQPSGQVPGLADLVPSPRGWWLVNIQDGRYPAEDARFYSGREFRAPLAYFSHVDTRNAPVFNPADSSRPRLEIKQLLTPLHPRFVELDAHWADDARLRGQFRDAGGDQRYEFAVVRGCAKPAVPPCVGRVVSRGVGRVSPLSFEGGTLELSEPQPTGGDFSLSLRAPSGSISNGNLLWERSVPYDITELRISRDRQRILAFREWDELVAYSLRTSNQLWTAKLVGYNSCTLETDRGTVVGHRDHSQYHFNLVAPDSRVTPLFELAGSWQDCALALTRGGLFVATSYDDREGAQDGTHVFADVRQRPTYRTRIAPLSFQGVALAPALTMPGGAPVAWIAPDQANPAARGVYFLTAHWRPHLGKLQPRGFAWRWTHHNRPVDEPSEDRFGFAGVPSDYADPRLPTWDVWIGDDRSCDE